MLGGSLLAKSLTRRCGVGKQFLHGTTAAPLFTNSFFQINNNNSNSIVNNNINNSNVIQVRHRWTKARKKRQERYVRNIKLAEDDIAKPTPPFYYPRDSPVVQTAPRPTPTDAQVAQELHIKGSKQQQHQILRFHMTGLVETSTNSTNDTDTKLSDPAHRVAQLLQIKNGSQRQVVAAQKHAGMALFQRRNGDTGSSAVQVVALSTRIQQMTTHMRSHHKDKHSKRGLDAMYVRRRKLLDYMERKEYADYVKVVKTLGLVRQNKR